MLQRLLPLFICIMAILSFTTGLQAASYSQITLGTGYSRAYGINDYGTTVGYDGTNASYRAYLWDSTGAHQLGAFSGTFTAAYSINNSGIIAGYSYDSANRAQPVTWDSTGISGLTTLGRRGGRAYWINNNGQIVGNTSDLSGNLADLWDLYGTYDLAPQSGYAESIAYSMNNAGSAVGVSTVWTGSDYLDRGTLWNSIGAHDLAPLSGFISSYARSINLGGSAVGWSSQGGSLNHATLWDSTGAHDLGTLSGMLHSRAYGINDSGVIVGSAWGSSGVTHAVVWDSTGIHDLGVLSGTGVVAEAFAISNTGYIAGYYYDNNGNPVACKWAPVPEPSALMALVCGLGSLGLILRRR